MEHHGGDWVGYTREYGAEPLDFSANVSPLGLPEGVRRAAEAALRQADRYPDGHCRALREALGQRFAIDPAQIVCGSGAADLIHRLPRALHCTSALLPTPCFTEYEAALHASGCAVRRVPLSAERDFTVTTDLLEAVEPGLDLLLLAQPNNPTGRSVEPALLRALLRRCAETGTMLVVDECFVELMEQPEDMSLAGELKRSETLILLRAFTKSYAMAGLRLGYALCGSTALAERLEEAGAPWAVSSIAQAAGLAALREDGYVKRLRALIRQQRPILYEGLTALGCRCVPGEANFLLFYYPDTELCDKLRKRGLLLRDARDFVGLGPGWYRCAVRTEEENRVLLRTMEEVLQA